MEHRFKNKQKSYSGALKHDVYKKLYVYIHMHLDMSAPGRSCELRGTTIRTTTNIKAQSEIKPSPEVAARGLDLGLGAQA